MPETTPPPMEEPPLAEVKTTTKIPNVYTPEIAATVQRNMGPSAFDNRIQNAGNRKKADKWLKDTDSESGRFIAIPLSMLELRKSKAKLTLSEVFLLGYIHGFQRSNQLGSCRARSLTIAEMFNLSESALSKHFTKIKKIGLVEKTGRGEEGAFRVNEKTWAILCECHFDPDDAKTLHEWTSKGKFCRIPLWIIRDADLTPLDKIVFGFVFSFYAGKESIPFRMSTQNAASALKVSKSKLRDSLQNLTDLGLLKKTELGDRIPAEYRIVPEACYDRGKGLIK